MNHSIGFSFIKLKNFSFKNLFSSCFVLKKFFAPNSDDKYLSISMSSSRGVIPHLLFGNWPNPINRMCPVLVVVKWYFFVFEYVYNPHGTSKINESRGTITNEIEKVVTLLCFNNSHKIITNGKVIIK